MRVQAQPQQARPSEARAPGRQAPARVQLAQAPERVQPGASGRRTRLAPSRCSAACSLRRRESSRRDRRRWQGPRPGEGLRRREPPGAALSPPEAERVVPGVSVVLHWSVVWRAFRFPPRNLCIRSAYWLAGRCFAGVVRGRERVLSWVKGLGKNRHEVKTDSYSKPNLFRDLADSPSAQPVWNVIMHPSGSPAGGLERRQSPSYRRITLLPSPSRASNRHRGENLGAHQSTLQ